MPEGLSRRVGPLPVWGWIVVGLVAYLVWRRRTEPGWFPGTSYPIAGGGGGSGGGGGFRSFLGMGGGGDDLVSEPPLAGSVAERPVLPSPIIAGGPDGTSFGTGTGYTGGLASGGGGTTTGAQPVPIGASPYGSGKTSPYGSR